MTNSTLRAALILLSLCVSQASTAEVYRSVDENGKVIFSDQATDGAEAVEVGKTNSLPAVSTPTRPVRQTGLESGYESVRIISPLHDAAVVSRAGEVVVSVELIPPLKADHRLQLLLDGAVQNGAGGTWALSGLERGTHQLEARVVDGSGEVILSSGSSSVHIIWPGTGRGPAR